MATTPIGRKPTLSYPFAVNISGMSKKEISELMDKLVKLTGAAYFRTKTLQLEVIADRIAKAANPQNFLYGPYLRVLPRPDGTLRITSDDHAQFEHDVRGVTVYGLDQIETFIAQAEQQTTAPAEPTQTTWPRPKP